eukprot:11137704-Karenia_brevis.AAC.1
MHRLVMRVTIKTIELLEVAMKSENATKDTAICAPASPKKASRTSPEGMSFDSALTLTGKASFAHNKKVLTLSCMES